MSERLDRVQPGEDTPVARYRRRARDLMSLNSAANELAIIRDVDAAILGIVRRARALLGSDLAYLMLVDPATGRGGVQAADGAQTPDFLAISLDSGEGVGGLVIETRAPQWAPDYTIDARFAPSISDAVAHEGVRGVLGVPLLIAAEVVGVLFAADRAPRDFTHEDVALLIELAEHASAALHNARLFESNAEAMKRLQAANARIEEINHRLNRTIELHQELNRLAASGRPVGEIADALSRSFGAWAAIYDPDGIRLSSTRHEIAADRLQKVRARTERMQTAAGEECVVAPVRSDGTTVGYIACGTGTVTTVDERDIERAGVVVALSLAGTRARDEGDRRLSQEVVSELASGLVGASEARERLESHGWRLARGPWITLAVEVQGSRRMAEETSALARARGGVIHRWRGSDILVLTGDDARAVATEVVDHLRRHGGSTIRIGACGPSRELRDALSDRARAVDVVRALRSMRTGDEVATFDELGAFAVLLGGADRDQLDRFVGETLGAVLEYDRAHGTGLLATLAAFLDESGQVSAVAAALHVHVNTVYARLARLDALLGAGWARGERALHIHFAARVAVDRM